MNSISFQWPCLMALISATKLLLDSETGAEAPTRPQLWQ